MVGWRLSDLEWSTLQLSMATQFYHQVRGAAFRSSSVEPSSVIHGSERAWPVGDPLVDPAHIYVKFSDEVIIPKKVEIFGR